MVDPMRLRTIVCCTVIAAAFALPGCSIHPLPGDIPRVPTSDIVERIRCEVQEGLRSFSQENPDTRRIVERVIRGTTIGYEFAFTITEDNSATHGNLTFTENRFSGGSLTLDLRPSATLMRNNQRAFFVTEALAKVDGAKCLPEATATHWAYPITGATGMAEVVRSYIGLQLLTNLKGFISEPVTDPTRPKFHEDVFSDHLTYTTSFTAGATPTLQLNAGVGSLRLTNASIMGTAHRNDIHEVTVALSFDENAAGTDAGLVKAKQERRKWTEIEFASRALRRVAQRDSGAPNRVLIELQRRRKVREDERVTARVLLGTTP
jgi:hypothetical protein